MKNPLDVNGDGNVNRDDAKAAADRAGRAIRQNVRDTTSAYESMDEAEKKATRNIGIAVGIVVIVVLAIIWLAVR